ncbi:phage tail protein I [Marinomonas arenicola]|uniref:phage tail protein I n=1 Tax=Marinomonas arenicola TaxID=569601 RepID=UPI00311F6265
MSDSLLPSSASALERAFERVAKRSTGFDMPVAVMWSPAAAPLPVLPWLAWSLSVDEWGSEWPEDVKREAIAASPQVHRLKGTVGAVRRALAALGVNIELVEWWQNGGDPHTASLIAYASRNLNESGQTLLTPELQQQIWNVVQRTKPARSHLDFTIGVSLASGVAIAATANTFGLGRHDYDLMPPVERLSGGLSSVSAIHDSMVVGRAPVVTDSSCLLSGGVVVYGVPFGCVINRFSMRVS